MEQQGRKLIIVGLILFPGVWLVFVALLTVQPLRDMLSSIDHSLRWVPLGVWALAVVTAMVLPLVGMGLFVAGIAVRKGRSLWLWLAMGSLFPLIALVVVLFLKASADVKVEAGQKKCPHCGEWVDRSASQCRYCLGALPTPDPAYRNDDPGGDDK